MYYMIICSIALSMKGEQWDCRELIDRLITGLFPRG